MNLLTLTDQQGATIDIHPDEIRMVFDHQHHFRPEGTPEPAQGFPGFSSLDLKVLEPDYCASHCPVRTEIRLGVGAGILVTECRSEIRERFHMATMQTNVQGV